MVYEGSSPPAATGVVVLDGDGAPLVWTPPAARYITDLVDGSDTPRDDLVPDVTALLGMAGAPSEPDARAGSTTHIAARGRSGEWYDVAVARGATASGPHETIVVTIKPRAGRATPADALLDALTPREREVVALAARGESTKSIARVLGLSRHTVQEHVGNACERLHVRSRRELIARVFVDPARIDRATDAPPAAGGA